MVQGPGTEPRSDGTRREKRKALEILGIDSIEISPDPQALNVSASVPPVDNLKRRRLDHDLDQPHRDITPVPTASDLESSSIVSWLHNGDDPLVCNHIYMIYYIIAL